MNSLTKSDLIEAVYERIGFSKKEATDVVEGALDIIKETLGRHETVKISGFGSFEVRLKQARRGRNPQTSGDLVIPARYVLTFRPSQLLRGNLNPGRKASRSIPPSR